MKTKFTRRRDYSNPYDLNSVGGANPKPCQTNQPERSTPYDLNKVYPKK